MRNVGFPKGLPIDAHKIESQLRNQAEGEFGCVLAVVLNSSGELIGQAKMDLPDSNMVARTDIKLLPQFWGNKFGVEIKRALLGYLFANTSCKQVTVDPNVNNVASIRMQEAVGGRKTGEGVHRFPEEMKDYTTDVHYVVYTVFRDDWQP
jgi:RimJ/RimL family protein N-acetyltransferase